MVNNVKIKAKRSFYFPELIIITFLYNGLFNHSCIQSFTLSEFEYLNQGGE